MPTLKWIVDHIDSLYVGGKVVCCVNCAHFHQHYVLDERRGQYIATNCGHCTCTQRIKRRQAVDSCEHFKARP